MFVTATVTIAAAATSLSTPPPPPLSLHHTHSGLSSGKGYVDVSTIDPATSAKVAAAVRAKGALYLEAPVSGSKGPAEQGQLIFLTAGVIACVCV